MTNEEIKTHINERLEALKLELERKFIRLTKEPEFEDGVWYSNGNGYAYGLFSKMGSFNKGFVNDIWYDNIRMMDVSEWKKVTDFTELEEIFKKDAVKRGMVDGAYKLFEDGTKRKIEYPLWFARNTKNLIDDNGLILMDAKGNWSELVKEKTTEEWIIMYQKSEHNLNKFLEVNNLEITRKK